ncbi:protein of unknown function [Bradyrhizobium vignae]|uniref:HTH hxlR-type domain-containing protein n=1 Tax=Bradyrhizobium vignae TaxID=1549949 RepID=A0A2U3PV20_9BRAD|nr:protein of unknown function [Bradyrhizobium vignae]
MRRFHEFELYVGIAPNILSARLKKLVSAGIMRQVPLPEHSRRNEYVLTEKGRDFFPAYLALKKWGDGWLADRARPQVSFRERTAGDLVTTLGPEGPSFCPCGRHLPASGR